MTEQWIDAGTALDVFGNRMALCERCHAGLIRSHAQRFKQHDRELADVELPQEFWWAEGHEALEQNWDTGDFSTWIDRALHWRAFGVRFALEDLLKLIPFERHAATRRQLSVAGSPDWVSAREARKFAYEKAGLQPVTAGRAVIEQCRVGFVSARAVEMRWVSGGEHGTPQAREWDVPTWFWENLTAPHGGSQNWEQGSFAARGRGPERFRSVALSGVHFLLSSLEVLLPRTPTQGQLGPVEPPKPNLPEGDLQRWWAKLQAVREGLSQNHLWTLAKADHPEHTVARDRIRALAENRKPGPKVN